MHGIRDTTSPSAPLQDSFYPGIMEETAAACLCLPAATVVSTGAQGAQSNSSLAITFFFCPSPQGAMESQTAGMGLWQLYRGCGEPGHFQAECPRVIIIMIIIIIP